MSHHFNQTLNITLDALWSDSLALRFPQENFIKYKNYSLIKTGDEQVDCYNYFLNANDIQQILEFISSRNTHLHLKYCNISTLEEVSLAAKMTYIKTSWNSPILELKANENLVDCLRAKSYRVRRWLKALNETKGETIINGTSNISDNFEHNVLLWKSICEIELDSWKGKQGSDLISLKREDLQYLLPITLYPDQYSLYILNHYGVPQAYSLMARTQAAPYWFNVKWGCSTAGRLHSLGILCLLEHIDLIKKKYALKDELVIDFWGRNNSVYDELATTSIMRTNLEIKNVL